MNRAVVLSVLLVALLAGCAPTPPAPAESTPPPVAEPTPTPTPTVDPVTAPEPLLDLTCDSLVGDGVGQLFTGGVSATDPERTIAEAGTSIAYKYAVEQLGGLACEWSNGVPQSDKTGADPNYVGVAMTIAPATEAQWATFRDYYSVKKDRQVYCFTDTGFFCGADVFVDGWWIESQATGIDTVKAKALLPTYRAVIDEVIANVTTANATGASWAEPKGTLPLSADCADVLTAGEAKAASGAAQSVELGGPSGGASLDSVVRDALATPWCLYYYAGEEDLLGALRWLPGGEWAWLEESEFTLLGGAPEEITVAGLSEGESAWVRCYSQQCELDLIVGHNWINYTLYDGSRAGIEKTAAAIVARVKG